MIKFLGKTEKGVLKIDPSTKDIELIKNRTLTEILQMSSKFAAYLLPFISLIYSS